MDSNGDGIGDLQGIIQKLDYLKKLGIDIIWLSPIYDSPNDDNGYDIRNYYQIMQEFGTMEDFNQMLDEIHQRDMKLMMDIVVNHTSDEHEWFQRYHDFYFWQDQPNNWNSLFSGPAWEYDAYRGQYYLHIFSKKQPDLNWENPKVREKVYDMMRWWLDKGVDGFRMDVINFISKDPELPDGPNGDGSAYFMNGPRIHEYLREMNKEVLSKYDCVSVGEMPGTTPEDAKRYTDPNNRELNMIFTFEHMDLDGGPNGKWDLKPLDLVGLKENLEKWQHALHDVGWNSLYWNNHDQPRIVSRFGDDGRYRVKSSKMLATCLHMMQGTPYIYKGEEIGMNNCALDSIDAYRDIETLNMYKAKHDAGVDHETIMTSIYAKGRDNASTPMQWSDASNGGFTTGEPWLQVNPNYKDIHVEAALQNQNSIFYHYQQLIQLRKTIDVMTTGSFHLLYREHPDIFAYERQSNAEKLTVYCNFSVHEHQFDLPDGDVLIHNYKELASTDKLILRPWEAVVFYVNGGHQS